MLKYCLFSLFLCATCFAQNQYPLVPLPARLVETEGQFTLLKGQKILLTGDVLSKQTLQLFVNQVNISTDLGLSLVSTGTSNVSFTLVKNTSLDEEGYKLSIKKDKISVEAESPRGFFYATQTLLQLLPPQVFGNTKTEGLAVTLPCCEITDRPRYVYRGLHLDVSRHFFPVSFIKRYIDLMAIHKMNYFHWHLTDDQGWRIEIKKYPKLTQIGAKRKQSELGHDDGHNPPQFDGKEYGGFYTQAEIKDVVAYATARYVTVVPEIEMPGHALAALAAYPEFSCEPNKTYKVAEKWGIYEDVFCPSDKTFKFLEDVLTEVMAIFPSKYIHIGGDECPKEAWKKSKFCQDLMKKQGLKSENELQSFFIKRIEKFVSSKGRKIIGWDEILDGGIAPNVTVMSWRGTEGGFNAIKQGHDAIMTPTDYCYLDYYQGNPIQEPTAIGNYLPIEKVYGYDPSPTGLTEAEENHVLGVQANLWSEYTSTPAEVEYMVFPRAAAMAEVAWSPKGAKNWNDFAYRLDGHFKRFDALKVNYAKAFFDVTASSDFTDKGQLQVRLKTADDIKKVFYTLDGKEPSDKSPEYERPILILKTTKIKAKTITGRIFEQNFIVHKATGKKYTLKNPPSEDFTEKEMGLTDGTLGIAPQDQSQFVVFDKDLEMTIDLGEVMPISKVSTNFAKIIMLGTYPPGKLEVSISKDDKEYREAATLPLSYDLLGPWKLEHAEVQVKGRGRYIKIKAQNVTEKIMALDEVVVE